MKNFTLSDEIRELAAGYVLDELECSELEAFEQMMVADAGVRQEVRELQIALGGLSIDVPPIAPPAHMRAEVLAALGVVDDLGDKPLIAPRKKGTLGQ
jgi:anti-sigma-K factor RskA